MLLWVVLEKLVFIKKRFKTIIDKRTLNISFYISQEYTAW